MKDHYADNGWLLDHCTGCGKPAAEGEEIEVIQVSSREGMWMHPPCAQRYYKWCEKEQEKFWTHNEIPKFVRGEASDITPGTVGESLAKIAKHLVSQTPALARPENWRALSGLHPV